VSNTTGERKNQKSDASLAQLVEHFISNEEVVGSSPARSSTFQFFLFFPVSVQRRRSDMWIKG
jgi:hypothetical protein